MTQFLWIHAVAMRVCMFHIQIYVNMKHINCRTPLALSISGNPTFAECKKTLNALGIMSNLPSGGYIGLCKQSFLCRRCIFFFLPRVDSILDKVFAECPTNSCLLSKSRPSEVCRGWHSAKIAECLYGFAECLRHSAKHLFSLCSICR